MTWMMLRLALVVFAPSLLVQHTGEEAVVACTESRFSDAAESRDRDGFAAFLHPDARFVTDTVSRGPAEVLRSWAIYFDPKGPTIRWRPESVEVSDDGTLALSRGPFRIVGNHPQRGPFEQWGSFISIWRRGESGEWRVQFDTGADLGMEPTEAQRKLLESSALCEDSVPNDE